MEVSSAVQGIACIYVPVKDVYSSISWYRTNLGMQPSTHNPVTPEMEFVILTYPSKGPTVFLIHTPDGATLNFPNKEGDEIPAVCFQVKEIESLFDRMQANGVRMHSALQDRGGCGTNFKCYDPDGNLLDFNEEPKALPPLLTQVDHVQIPVRNLEESKDWYVNTLGCKVGQGSAGDLFFLELPNGPILVLWKTEEGVHNHFSYQDRPKPTLFFDTPNIKAVYDRLQEAGAKVGPVPETWEGDDMKFMFFYDLNGNYLGVIEAQGVYPGVA
jgi:catechol 2,3-dioxygenase-like lactoylglutathione lyase family enzyme